MSPLTRYLLDSRPIPPLGSPRGEAIGSAGPAQALSGLIIVCIVELLVELNGARALEA